jgi:hypothetical protein
MAAADSASTTAATSVSPEEARSIAAAEVESGFDRLATVLAGRAEPAPAPAPTAEPPKDEAPKEVTKAKKKRRRFADLWDGIGE